MTLEGLHVVKMNGAKNDFVLIDERPSRISSYSDLAKRLCDRVEGIGADGLLVVLEAPGHAGRMRVFNADGSEAESCGNGIRCVARYLAERGAGERFTIAIAPGVVEAQIVAWEPEFLVRIDMGKPTMPQGGSELEAAVLGQTWRFFSVDVGNPHAVIFVDDVEAVDLLSLGAQLQRHPLFPSGVNVHAAQALDRHTLRVRHYERGVGLTQACGTGAVACAVAAIAAERAQTPIAVHVPGGELKVNVRPDGCAEMTGPAVVEFERRLA